jgi:hypothetical protein
MVKEVIGILGLLAIIIGNLTIYKPKSIRKKYTYPLLIIGGIFLTIYSVLIRDIIFIILQTTFILAAIYGLIKINKRIKSLDFHQNAKKNKSSAQRGKLNIKKP